MRVLFMCAAGLGHIHPLIPLVRAAAAFGDEVLVAVPAAGVRTVEGMGFRTTTIPYGDPADIGRAWAKLPDKDLNTYVVADIFIRIQARSALPALVSAVEGFSADLVVSAEFGAMVAAQVCGVPSALVGITALDVSDLDLGRVVGALDDLRAAAGVSRTGTMPYAAGSEYLSAVPPMLWADTANVPPNCIWYRHEDAEGPVTASTSRASGRRPRVYATLGSVAGSNDLGRPIFGPVLDALGRLDADVLFTVGSLDRDQLGAIPSSVRVTAYTPQAEAMDCDAVVLHAGSGTTVAALARGLPMVAVPMFADQSHNADRLVSAGIGLRVDPDQVADELTASAERVLIEPTFRINAQRVAAEIAARPSAAAALDGIRQTFVI